MCILMGWSVKDSKYNRFFRVEQRLDARIKEQENSGANTYGEIRLNGRSKGTIGEEWVAYIGEEEVALRVGDVVKVENTISGLKKVIHYSVCVMEEGLPSLPGGLLTEEMLWFKQRFKGVVLPHNRVTEDIVNEVTGTQEEVKAIVRDAGGEREIKIHLGAYKIEKGVRNG